MMRRGASLLGVSRQDAAPRAMESCCSSRAVRRIGSLVTPRYPCVAPMMIVRGSRFASTSSHHSSQFDTAPVEGEYDVAVIGCGILGACTALHLTRAGYKVAVIDQKHGPGDGSTSYSTGLVRAFYSTYDVSAIAYEAYHQFLVWKDYLRISDKNYQTATMRLCPAIFPQINGEDDSFIQKVLPIANQLNMPVERMTFEEMKAHLSKMDWDCDHVYHPRKIDDENFDVPDPARRYTHAYKFPKSAYYSDPRQVVVDVFNATKDPANHGTDGLAVHLPVDQYVEGTTSSLLNGGHRSAPSYFFKSKVVHISKTRQLDGTVAVDGAVITNADGSSTARKIKARIVVNCAGPWSNKITPLAFDGAGIVCDNNVTTRPLRVEFAVLKSSSPACDMENDGAAILIDNDLGFYSRPEPGNRILVGGIEAPCDPEVYFDDASEAETATTSDIYKYSAYRAALRIPSIDVPTGRAEAGGISAYDVTEDWNPILDRSNLIGYYQAIGTSGNCFKTAPVMTKMLSELIIKEDHGIVPRLGEGCHDLNPLKMHLPIINADVSLAMFSRLRSVEGASTKNVFA